MLSSPSVFADDRRGSPLQWLPLLAVVLAPAAGVAAAVDPKLVFGGVAGLCVLLLAFRKPVANLALLLFLTTVVPFQVLNRFSVGGGINSPGLLLSDLFLLSGLAWAALALPSLPLDRRRYVYAGAVVAFLALVGLQFLHGLRAGYNRSAVGQEGRVLLGVGTYLIALPLLAHMPSRRRLLGALSVVAFLLGAWGMVQWLGHFSFGAAGDVGVRAGVRLTSGGSGQLQGGEFAFPLAIIICFAALAFGSIRSRLWRALLAAAIALNVASCLVTFERSFWLDALVGVAVVLSLAPSGRRLKVLATMAAVAALGVGTLSVLSPTTLTTAHQRLNSIGSYGSDAAVRYRVVESGLVYNRIRAHPVAGSGLGATMLWGQPWARVRPKMQHYSHDGYLWLGWKVGIPAATLLVLLLVGALFGRTRPDEQPLSAAVRRGARGAIVGLLIATVTFPSFSQLGITPAIGLLLALAVSPALREPVGAGGATHRADRTAALSAR